MIYAIPTDTCFGFAASLIDEAGFNLIYDMKGRDANKKISFAVKRFDDLYDTILINHEQYLFLKQYPHPFTILGKRSDRFDLPEFLCNEDYGDIAVRIGDICLSKGISDTMVFPIFLTSANISGEKELYSDIEIKERFGNVSGLEIIEGVIPDCPPSDIFSFIGDTLEIEYIRRNY